MNPTRLLKLFEPWAVTASSKVSRAMIQKTVLPMVFAFMLAEPSVTLAQQSFPKKKPVLTYQLPADWKVKFNANGSVTFTSADGRIGGVICEMPAEATMDLFKDILPAMVKDIQDTEVVEKASELTWDRLPGFTANYSAKIYDKPASCMFMLFKGDKKHSVLINLFVSDPETLPEEDVAAEKKFGSSLKAIK
jgi:hypothetical protein